VAIEAERTVPYWRLRDEGGCRRAGIWVASTLFGSGAALAFRAASGLRESLERAEEVRAIVLRESVHPERRPAMSPASPREATFRRRRRVREAGRKCMS
jgi:hypothetical protein